MTDQLQGSPVLAEVLGDALPKLERFHAKIAEEGEPRGLIGPRDVDIIWERHILNSAAIVPYVRNATNGIRFKNSCRRRQWWWFSWIGGCRVFAGS